MSDNVLAVPEPVRGVVGVFGMGRTGWVEGSVATEARNGLLTAGSPITAKPVTGRDKARTIRLLILHDRPESGLKDPLG